MNGKQAVSMAPNLMITLIVAIMVLLASIYIFIYLPMQTHNDAMKCEPNNCEESPCGSDAYRNPVLKCEEGKVCCIPIGDDD